MRRDVTFDSEGARLSGWLYLPERAAAPVPAIVMAHGFSGVKEMFLDRYADVFAAAGFGVLVFDYRGFGASGGEPRQEVDPWGQVRDFRNAISHASALAELDRNRIGVWGSSYGGGHALVLGAIDKRVKCVVAQVPLCSGSRNIRRLVRADLIAGMRAMFAADRAARYAGAPPAMIPVVAESPLQPSALPTPDSWTWFTETGRTRAPAWRNEVTLRSVEMLTEYEPAGTIDQVSPTPLMMVVGAHDDLAAADLALEAYARALEPKRLVLLRGGHFDAYVNEFDTASTAARDWFVEHLRP
jgi:fermentation-respiration switch protein FrsA (DUF1100 family)